MQLSSPGAAGSWRAAAPSLLCRDARQERAGSSHPAGLQALPNGTVWREGRRQLPFLAAASSARQPEASALVGEGMRGGLLGRGGGSLCRRSGPAGG